jgi:hypothetical protein
MIKDISSLTALIVSVVIATIILIYHTFQIWFSPAKYLRDLGNGVKDWWPSANFYRQWYGSKSFLWLFRIAYTVTLLVLVILLTMLLLGIMGLFP